MNGLRFFQGSNQKKSDQKNRKTKKVALNRTVWARCGLQILNDITIPCDLYIEQVVSTNITCNFLKKSF